MDSQFSSTQPADQTRAEAAEHIALEASRLAHLANAQELELLAHLIDMVVLEAWREVTEPESSGPQDPAQSPD